jgi:hypothetical protein
MKGLLYVITIFIFIIYGVSTGIKAINYWPWYDGSVQQEIVRMVKPECLKEVARNE